MRSASELDEFNRILARKVDLVNPKQKEAPTATGSNAYLADQEICVISDRNRYLVETWVPASSSYF